LRRFAAALKGGGMDFAEQDRCLELRRAEPRGRVGRMGERRDRLDSQIAPRRWRVRPEAEAGAGRADGGRPHGSSTAC
jgi:hypothetical protein